MIHRSCIGQVEEQLSFELIQFYEHCVKRINSAVHIDIHPKQYSRSKLVHPKRKLVDNILQMGVDFKVWIGFSF